MSTPKTVVWITGGGTGIGKAVAIAYAQKGCAVAISGRRIERLTETVAAIEAAGGQGLAVQCDVGIEEENKKAVEQIVAHWGRLDIAIANAEQMSALFQIPYMCILCFDTSLSS